jgi:hypothetical protein
MGRVLQGRGILPHNDLGARNRKKGSNNLCAGLRRHRRDRGRIARRASAAAGLHVLTAPLMSDRKIERRFPRPGYWRAAYEWPRGDLTTLSLGAWFCIARDAALYLRYVVDHRALSALSCEGTAFRARLDTRNQA